MASVPRRFGVTVPFPGVALHEHREWYEEVAALGFTDVWSGEANSHDGFTPLALAAAWAPTLRSGVAIAPAFTRGPALLAQTAASMSDAAPGRFALGIGASSPVVVEDWNAVPFERPLERSRDVLRFLRAALAGEVVDGAFETFQVRRFRLERPPAVPPRLFLAGLRGGMLRLAAAEADGAILNWLGVQDLPRVRAELTGAAEGFEVAARIFVCPTPDVAYARETGRRLIAAYLTVPAYAAFHRWLGRGDELKALWELWAAGDRKGAAASVPDEVVDALIVHGTPEECREHVRRYAAGGVDTPVMALLPTPELQRGGPRELMSTLEALGGGPAS
jgi:probable F420-dependent oxidoreductase